MRVTQALEYSNLVGKVGDRAVGIGAIRQGDLYRPLFAVQHARQHRAVAPVGRRRQQLETLKHGMVWLSK